MSKANYAKLKTPMQAIRAVLALGVDQEGDIIIPGKLESDDFNMVKALRRIAVAHKGVE